MAAINIDLDRPLILRMAFIVASFMIKDAFFSIRSFKRIY